MIYDLIRILWYDPIEKLYWYGPIWFGQEKADICSQLTQVPSSHWMKEVGKENCELLLKKKFDSFYIGFNSFIYFLSLFSISFIFIKRLIKKLV